MTAQPRHVASTSILSSSLSHRLRLPICGLELVSLGSLCRPTRKEPPSRDETVLRASATVKIALGRVKRPLALNDQCLPLRPRNEIRFSQTFGPYVRCRPLYI